jgi:hypothetical protein
MEEDKRSIGEILKEKIKDQNKSYSDFFTNLFIYGPDLLSKTIEELKKEKDERLQTNS